MSTDLKPTKAFALTQFCGRFNTEKEDRTRLQVTGANEKHWNQQLTLDKSEAMDLAIALLQWVNGSREKED